MKPTIFSQRIISELDDRVVAIRQLVGIDSIEWKNWPLEESCDALMSVRNFHRWLLQTSSPRMQFEVATENRSGFQHFLNILAASQPLADSIVQNPEFGQLVIEQEYGKLDDIKSRLMSEGEMMLRSADSLQYAQDRLRFLKQKVRLGIADEDLSMTDPSTVWRALSDEADALLCLALKASWKRFAREKGLTEDVPIEILAFGKLGGRELNYSSDVDLVFVANRELGAENETQIARFCQIFVASLAEKMGRGNLYRVDLRLRPFGAGGALVVSAQALFSYYRNYAEPWEILALLRARWITNPSLELIKGLDEVRSEVCFRREWSDASIEEILKIRERIDSHSDENDFKRGRGGIRDIEFLVQIYQLVLGAQNELLRNGTTLEILSSLANQGVIDQEEYKNTSENYTFLRQLEHRCQLLSDLQTHRLPNSDEDQEKISFLLGFPSHIELIAQMETCKLEVSMIYDRHWGRFMKWSGTKRFPFYVSTSVQHLFLKIPNSESLLAAVSENRDSLTRLNMLVDRAPVLVPFVENSIELLEQLISGEIEESLEPLPSTIDFSDQSSLKWTYRLIRNYLQWTINQSFDLGEEITLAYEQQLCTLVNKYDVNHNISIIGLGSLGRREMAFGSDMDVLFLVADRAHQPRAENAIQSVLMDVERMKQLGCPIAIDLRLRPDGSKGLLVRTYDALRFYSANEADLWERFAIGQYRLIQGNPCSETELEEFAYGLPLTRSRLDELIAMKRRIETERVQPQHLWRDVKLGYGGLSDIEWLVHLNEMRHSHASLNSRGKNLINRVQNLTDCGLINTVECEELKEAYLFLMKLRYSLALLEPGSTILPENPIKLTHISSIFGLTDGNELIKLHQEVADRTREIYDESILRLQGGSG